MKRILLILTTAFIIHALNAQNKNSNDHRTPVVKSESGWNKADNETPTPNTSQTIADGITLNTNQDGIFITMPKAIGNVKLFSLTGELVWAGNLVQGRFFIPTKAGIYFLKVNNKSYKVVCK